MQVPRKWWKQLGLGSPRDLSGMIPSRTNLVHIQQSVCVKILKTVPVPRLCTGSIVSCANQYLHQVKQLVLCLLNMQVTVGTGSTLSTSGSTTSSTTTGHSDVQFDYISRSKGNFQMSLFSVLTKNSPADLS